MRYQGPKLQTISSKISDILFKQETVAEDVLCFMCTNFTSQETIFSGEERRDVPFKMGSMSEVDNRACADQCPLCRVVLHIVSQALAGPRAGIIWPHSDLSITLELCRRDFSVYYNSIYVGNIELYPRTLHFDPDLYYRFYLRLKPRPILKFSPEFKRYVSIKEYFGSYGISKIWGCCTDLRIRPAMYISHRLDFKTAEYQYYSTLPRTRPSRNIDCSFLRSALRECEKSHGDECGADPMPITSQLPTEILLIDVAEGRLVKNLICSQKYLALSYVWGSAPMLKAMQSNLASLQQPGALLTLHSQLPRVLQDAIDLTRYLGERYLWCDALCIVQDDTQFKHAQIASMSLIYGQAFLTICALSSSDASSGLLGFSETVPGGLPVDKAECTKKYAYVSSPAELGDIVHLLPYETRAWTFQERLLSKRCLFFTATHFYFECRGYGVSSTNGFGKHVSWKASWNPLPEFWWTNKGDAGEFDVRFYQIIVEQYTMRQITYPEDVIDAFSAISLSLENHYSSKIRKGIPEAAFLSTLCWAQTKPLKRRKGAFEQHLRHSRVFPSWSWLGWEGPISFHHRDWPHKSQFLSYISHFLLEEGKDTTELNLGQLTQAHPDSCQKPTCFSLTGHPSMLHFVAYCVTSSSFRIANPNDEFQDARLYKATAEPKIITSKVLQQEDKSVIGKEEGQPKTRYVSGSKNPEDSPCGMIQLHAPSPWPPNEIILDCTYVLLCTIHHGAYSPEIWSSKLPWPDNFFEINYRWDRWAFNALLIKKKNGFWERIGFAVFTEDAWKSADPQERYIQLV